jgi:bacteriocin-like protein
MTVPADDTKKSDAAPAAADKSSVASMDDETKELTPDELQQVSGGHPKGVDWIQSTS